MSQSCPRLDVEPDEVEAEELNALTAALRGGGLVLIPTESGYEWAARSDSEALEILRETFSTGLHELHASAPLQELPAGVARRLARSLWPGPMILDLAQLKRRIRVPHPPLVRAAIAAVGVPVLGMPATLADGGTAITAVGALEELPPQVRRELALLVDGGPAPLPEGPCVLRLVSAESFERRRRGPIPEESLAAAAARQVLFVCTGNTCRSPVAAALLRLKLAEKLSCAVSELESRGWIVHSAGVAAEEGAGASEGSKTVAREMGFSLDEHESQPLEQELLARCDHIYALSGAHADAIAQRFPEAAGMTELLDARGVPDPYGGSLDEYRAMARHVEAAVSKLAENLSSLV